MCRQIGLIKASQLAVYVLLMSNSLLGVPAKAIDKEALHSSVNLLMAGQQSAVSQLDISKMRSMRDELTGNFDSVVAQIRERGRGRNFPRGYAEAVENYLRACYNIINEAVNFYDAKGGWRNFPNSREYKAAQKRIEGAFGIWKDSTIEYYRMNNLYPNTVEKYDKWKAGQDDTSQASAIGWKCKYSGTGVYPIK